MEDQKVAPFDSAPTPAAPTLTDLPVITDPGFYTDPAYAEWHDFELGTQRWDSSRGTAMTLGYLYPKLAGAGALPAGTYTLRITDVDPLAYDLNHGVLLRSDVTAFR